MQEALRAHGVVTAIHYPTSPHLQGAYADAGFMAGSFPLSERMHQEVLSLPMGPHLTDQDVNKVIKAVRAVAATLKFDARIT